MNSLSSWVTGILFVVMGLFGLLLTSRAEDNVTGVMGLIMFGFAVFFVFRRIINADRTED